MDDAAVATGLVRRDARFLLEHREGCVRQYGDKPACDRKADDPAADDSGSHLRVTEPS
jgi:hypothetical protein